MKTHILMRTSAGILAAAGICMTFFPQELLVGLGAEPQAPAVLVAQVVGALLLAFASLNWMSRDAPIGGIYGRPVSMPNFVHFAIGAITLSRGAADAEFAVPLTVVALVYTAYAVWFGLVVFVHPQSG